MIYALLRGNLSKYNPTHPLGSNSVTVPTEKPKIAKPSLHYALLRGDLPLPKNTPTRSLGSSEVIVSTAQPRISELEKETANTNFRKYQSQEDFIINKLRKRIVECGGNGNCLIYSILRQTKQFVSFSDKNFKAQKTKAMHDFQKELSDKLLSDLKSDKSSMAKKTEILIDLLNDLQNSSSGHVPGDFICTVIQDNAGEIIENLKAIRSCCTNESTEADIISVRENFNELINKLRIDNINRDSKKFQNLDETYKKIINDLWTLKSEISSLGIKLRSSKELTTLGSSLDAEGEEGAIIAKFFNRPVVVFSEHNPGYGKSLIGSFNCIFPSGESGNFEYNTNTPEALPSSTDKITEASLPANAILIYHSGNGQNGHYKAIM